MHFVDAKGILTGSKGHWGIGFYPAVFRER